LNKIFNFQQSKNTSLFLFYFFFSILACQYSFSYLLAYFILSAIFFSPVQSAVRPNRTFNSPTQLTLVIFDLQTSAATFDLPDCSAALCCIVRLRHRGASSSPLPLRKWSHSIAFPSPFLSHVTDTIQVLPSLHPPRL
jgi:hypothetical protein